MNYRYSVAFLYYELYYEICFLHSEWKQNEILASQVFWNYIQAEHLIASILVS